MNFFTRKLSKKYFQTHIFHYLNLENSFNSIVSMSKIWNLLPTPDAAFIADLQTQLTIPYDIASILIQRGIHSFDEARSFFRPDWEETHDPFLMQDMDLAVSRINKAIASNEKILLFGDYDVDGTTAVAVMWNVLTHFYKNILFYIPDRYNEGYGISTQGIDYANELNVGLIISLDCGIRANDKIDYAHSLGIDFIVCDHHHPGNEIPKAIVLDPQRKECNYPYKGLSGCGVGFKLLQALHKTNQWNETVLMQQLDLLAISIGADIVPITGENRIFCYHGLSVLNQGSRIGIDALLRIAKKELPLLLTDVVFVLAPRINAAGRIQSGNKAVELMISTDKSFIDAIAESIDLDNQERRELDAQITIEALEQIANDTDFQSRKTTVVYQEDWHKGVIGIVASRLIETHYKPTIVLTQSNGKLTGSARSIKGLDIHEALTRCEDVLEQFGGHTFAAGMTILPSNYDLFKKRFETAVNELLTLEQQEEVITVDAEISFDDLFQSHETTDQLPKFYRLLAQMEPYGPGNMKPIFLTRNVSVCDASLLKGEHIKALFTEGKQNRKIPAIGFRMQDLYPIVKSGKLVDILYTIETNTWKNKTTLQLVIKDIKYAY